MHKRHQILDTQLKLLGAEVQLHHLVSQILDEAALNGDTHKAYARLKCINHFSNMWLRLKKSA